MKKRRIVIPTILIVLVIIIVSIIVVLKKNMPSKEHMKLTDYFQVQEGKIQLIMQDEISDIQGLYEDGMIYLDMDVITSVLNPRFYWDSVENKLLYTTSSEVISTEINSNTYYTNKRKDTKDYTIVKVQDNHVYVAIDYVKQYTALDYKKFDSPDRVVINYIYDESEKYNTTKKETQLRYEPDTKSDVLVDMKSGVKLRILSGEDDNGFCQVMTEDGVIGYVKEDKLGSETEEVKTSDFQKEEYTHILLDEKINLVWHQVTNTDANNTMSSLLSSTKGVNVISPTWFKTIDNAGNISSIADYTYVENAHLQGCRYGDCVTILTLT